LNRFCSPYGLLPTVFLRYAPILSKNDLLETHTPHGLIRLLSRTARDKDVAAVDLHYLTSGTIAGTVILLKDGGWKESDVPAPLGSLGEDFLPDVDLDHGNLNYAVVLGEVLWKYKAYESKELTKTKSRRSL
jgi:hypothetical protein